MSACQRASSSSTPQSGKDRCLFKQLCHLFRCRSHTTGLTSRLCYKYCISRLLLRVAAFPVRWDLPLVCPFTSRLALVCFCAVCGWTAPWPGPAHCVHLLCCWCSGCLQHHRYSYPEIVSAALTHSNHWKMSKLCMFVLAPCQRIPGCHRSHCWRSLCLSSLASFSLVLDAPTWLPSLQEASSVGDEAAKLLCGFSSWTAAVPFFPHLLHSQPVYCSSIISHHAHLWSHLAHWVLSPLSAGFFLSDSRQAF